MFRRTLLVLIIPTFAMSIARASCGSASCPIDTCSTQIAEKGSVRFDYTSEYIDQNQPQIGRHKATVGEITGHHDEVSTLNEIQRFGVEAGLSDRLSVQLTLPFVHREHQHIHHHEDGDELETWNIDGMGDFAVLARYAFWMGERKGTRLSALAGTVFPTGLHNAKNAEGEEAEVGIQPGKGAYSFIAGASFNNDFSAHTLGGAHATLPFFVSSTYQWNRPGSNDYQMGNTWLANVGAVFPLFPKMGFLFQVNSRVALKDDRGNTNEEIEKTGGSCVYASPGLQFHLADNLTAYGLVQLPVYQRVNQIQLTSKYNFMMGLSYRFNVL